MQADEYIMQVACDEICYFRETATDQEALLDDICSRCPLDKAVKEVFSGYGENDLHACDSRRV